MSDSKTRILSRRSAFIAAATLTAACDRCTNTPSVCLSVSVVDAAPDEPDIIFRPLVCLSAPIVPVVEGDAGKEGGPITLKPIDIQADSGAPPPPPPMPCLSVAIPHPTPTPMVCLRK
jgi:hypothetical protein